MAYDPMKDLEQLGQPQQGPVQNNFGGGAGALGALGDGQSPGNYGGAGGLGALGDGQTQPGGQGGPGALGALGQSGNTGVAGPQTGATPQQTPQNGLDGTGTTPTQPATNGLEGTQPVGQTQPAANPGDPNAALGQVQNAFQQRFGRAMSPQEQQALQQYVGYTGGNVSPEMLQRAMGAVGQYSGDINNPFGPAAGGGPSGGDPGIGTNDLVQQQLQELLQTGSTPGMTLDPNNPAIQAQRSAFARKNSQQTGREKLAMAEQAAAGNNLGGGGFNADIAGAENARQGRAADFEGQLLGQELQGQRERVMQGLQLANQSGNAAMTRALQERLGMIDADIRRTGQRGQLGLGMLQTLLGNQRAQDALGFNYAQLGVNANQNLLNSILGAANG